MDFIQILIFIGAILFVASKKYKEVAQNRPGKAKPDNTDYDVDEEMYGDDNGNDFEPEMETDTRQELQRQPNGAREMSMDTENLVELLQRQQQQIIQQQQQMKHMQRQMHSMREYIRQHNQSQQQQIQPQVGSYMGQASNSYSQIQKKNNSAMRHNETTRKNESQKIRIDSPQEARRAFIYSEIMNRKY